MPDDISRAPFADILRQAIGTEAVDDTDATRALMSQDIWARGDLADLVVAPDTIDALVEAVRLAHDHKIALNPRGGGMSYTKAYAPDRAGVAMLDTTKLNRIVELNTRDMYVTVEAGCTWEKLHSALSAEGLRTPFWGPLSGLTSTVGGGLSQNNAFFGAGKYGSTGDSVLSVALRAAHPSGAITAPTLPASLSVMAAHSALRPRSPSA